MDSNGSQNAPRKKRNKVQFQLNNGNPCKKIRTKDNLEIDSAASKLIATELVMLNILSNLRLPCLKKCREINLTFKEYATKAIKIGKLSKVKFVFNWLSKKYFYAIEENVSEIPLSNLTQFLKSSPDFPSDTFEFLGGTLRAQDLQEFLLLHGTRRVKELTLDVFNPELATNNASTIISPQNPPQSLENNYPTISFLKQLLVNQVPNLQRLNIRKCPSQWNINLQRLFPEPKWARITLPNLKQLSIENDAQVTDHIVFDFLRVCIYLQQFQYDKRYKQDVILKANKFYLLDKLIFASSNSDNLALYEKIFPLKHCRLSKLIIFNKDLPLPAKEAHPRIENVLTEIFKASSSSLSQIYFSSPLGFLSDFKIPILPKIYFLAVDINRFLEHEYSTRKRFPPGFQFKQSFPNLRIFDCSLSLFKIEQKWEDYFDDLIEDPVESVRVFRIQANKFQIDWLQKFCLLFPNVVELDLRIRKLDFTDEQVFSVWNFQRLKKLKMEINLMNKFVAYPALDSLLTGFSVETCKELYGNSADVDCVERLDDLREFPSILKLKDLETLQLVFTDRSLNLWNNHPIVITHVAGLFAFKMCPKLKVSFKYQLGNDQNKWALDNALSSVKEYFNA